MLSVVQHQLPTSTDIHKPNLEPIILGQLLQKPTSHPLIFCRQRRRQRRARNMPDVMCVPIRCSIACLSGQNTLRTSIFLRRQDFPRIWVLKGNTEVIQAVRILSKDGLTAIGSVPNSDTCLSFWLVGLNRM